MTSYPVAVLVVGLVGLAALVSNRVAQVLRVPAPALMFLAAALVVQLLPGVDEPPERLVEQLVSVALVFILFDGGLGIGWRRFRSAAVPIATTGLVGTFLVVAAAAALLHLLGLSWFAALLVATAVAPTDPAMVFSVLGQREIEGRSSTIIEGESGANDPVGIALLAGLLAAGTVSPAAFAQVGALFGLQMLVGAALGVVGGQLMVVVIRRVRLPSEALYPIRTSALVLIIYAGTTLAHGSGFLAVFVAGIVIGDVRAPYKREVERFHSATAGVAEIVVFVVLGLTVRLPVLADPAVWVTGLVLAVVLTVVLRPLLVGVCLARSGLSRRETAFVLFAGLKGAVPILLAEMLREADVPGADELYGIVVVVVVFSVLLQATLTPAVATRLGLPVRTVEPEPWTLGARLKDEPEDATRFTVTAASAAAGRQVRDLDELGEDVWLNFVIRDGRAVPLNGRTTLQPDDQVLLQAPPDLHRPLTTFFEQPRADEPAGGDAGSPA